MKPRKWTSCGVCGAELATRQGQGRASKYCSSTCKDTATQALKKQAEQKRILSAALCTARGCNRLERGGGAGAGLCERHYANKRRHGHELTSREQRHFFLVDLVATPTAECVIWPFTCCGAGYGICADSQGRATRAHRQALVMLTGEDPKGLHACHGPCHNPRCVNPHPEHGMRWGTSRDNSLDRWRDGTEMVGEDAPTSKYSEDQIRKAYELYASGMLVRDIARQVGCTEALVTHVARGKTWKHLGLPALPYRNDGWRLRVGSTEGRS